MKKTQYALHTALISVSEKTGVIDIARELHIMNVKLLSTGGTSNLLQENSIPVTEISDYTGFPEIMGGRVKTLHPKIHGGLLARRDRDQAIMKHHAIEGIDLLVSNLYPFQKVTTDPTCDLETALENIDIGGVTLIRAAAKNYKYVTVVVDPADYPILLHHLQQGTLSESVRYELARKAFNYIAQYDVAIANYFEHENKQLFPLMYIPQYHKKQELRYGENPHQKAAFYVDTTTSQDQIVATAKQLQGKELSFNNIADTDTALECVKSFSEPACVIVKHANPCGVATSSTLLEAYRQAYSADSTSAFGGIIAFNKPLDLAVATAILDQQFVEVVIAPSVQNGVQQCFNKKPNVRLLTHKVESYQLDSESWLDYKRVNGGLLLQESDTVALDISQLKCVTNREPTKMEYKDLLFAWQVAKFVKSNAIVFAKNQVTVGIGGGQTSRVYSARIATMKAADAGLETTGAVMASDAFFPFRDGVDTAAEIGISAIIQPGGSIRDSEVIDAANAANIAMLFTGIRHFRH